MDRDWQSGRGAHPQYPSRCYTMSIYEVTGSAPSIRFAAGEFSNGVWGFFVPADLNERPSPS